MQLPQTSNFLKCLEKRKGLEEVHQNPNCGCGGTMGLGGGACQAYINNETLPIKNLEDNLKLYKWLSEPDLLACLGLHYFKMSWSPMVRGGRQYGTDCVTTSCPSRGATSEGDEDGFVASSHAGSIPPQARILSCRTGLGSTHWKANQCPSPIPQRPSNPLTLWIWNTGL